MYLPYHPNMTWALADGVDTILVKKPSVKRIRCDGCGKFMKLDTTYLVVENTYFRSHMKEECMTKVYDKAKERRDEFELAAMGAKQYGKP